MFNFCRNCLERSFATNFGGGKPFHCISIAKIRNAVPSATAKCQNSRTVPPIIHRMVRQRSAALNVYGHRTLNRSVRSLLLLHLICMLSVTSDHRWIDNENRSRFQSTMLSTIFLVVDTVLYGLILSEEKKRRQMTRR